MQSLDRTPLQGILNVARFNWHFYLLAFVSVVFFFVIGRYVKNGWGSAMLVLSALTALTVIGSLLATSYAYDRSGFYSFNWCHFRLAKTPV
jgi:hypothetical protein